VGIRIYLFLLMAKVENLLGALSGCRLGSKFLLVALHEGVHELCWICFEAVAQEDKARQRGLKVPVSSSATSMAGWSNGRRTTSPLLVTIVSIFLFGQRSFGFEQQFPGGAAEGMRDSQDHRQCRHVLTAFNLSHV